MNYDSKEQAWTKITSQVKSIAHDSFKQKRPNNDTICNSHQLTFSKNLRNYKA